ncbi:MAG: 5-methyltetrahydropteroyltriglutamate--homocysteine S-methyltransferase, partial [Longimicrobiales bacterium]
MPLATNLGFPRIGAGRELKRALELYWRGGSGADALLETARILREAHWRQQAAQGIDHIPSGDFSLYDHVLDTAVLVGAVPRRYGWSGGVVGLDTYFAMARGIQEKDLDVERAGTPAMEMTKWFDTNYHYIVPELGADQTFALTSDEPVLRLREARALGIETRPVLLGPVSFLLLGKAPAGDVAPLVLLDRLLPVYIQVFESLAAAGADWIQVDEPWLVRDLDDDARVAYRRAYESLAGVDGVRTLLTSYFGGLGENLDLALSL